MPTAAVHIGLPKTGSTTIQAFLAANRQALAGRGVVVDPPRHDRWSQLEYGLVACSRAGRPIPDEMVRHRLGLARLSDQDALADAFEAWLDERLAGLGDAHYVISSEHLGIWLTEPETRAALDTWLTARFGDVRYILFVRPQAEFILSSWSESIRRGSDRTLADFVAGYDELDVHATMRAWDADFGARLTILAMPKGAALLAAFAEAAGLPAGLPEGEAPRNPALNARAAEILRRINAVIGPAVGRSPLKRAAFAAIRRAVTVLVPGPRLRLSSAQVAGIEARYPHSVPAYIAARARPAGAAPAAAP